MACSTRSPIEALALALVLLAALPAWAGTAEAQAKAAAKAGKAAYQLGRFDEALAHYEKAWAAMPVPGLLFNLGQCHRQLDHTEQALHYFKLYLESGPPAAQAKATREVVAKLEAQLADEQRRAAVEAQQQRALEMEKTRAEAARVEAEKARDEGHLAELERARKAAEADRAAEAARRAELEAALKAAPPAGPPGTPVYQRWWFWTGLGVVAAGAATGIALAATPHATPTTFQDINAR